MSEERYSICVTFRSLATPVDRKRLHLEGMAQQAAQATLLAEKIGSAEISLVFTDDAEIHRINREFLDHDYPTDVISFRLDDGPPVCPPNSASALHLEGELIISLETAERAAAEQGCSLEAELVLYVVHGLLHLCGYDDQTDLARSMMRRREREILRQWNLSRGGESAFGPGKDVLA